MNWNKIPIDDSVQEFRFRFKKNLKEVLMSDSYPAFFLPIATTSNKNF